MKSSNARGRPKKSKADVTKRGGGVAPAPKIVGKAKPLVFPRGGKDVANVPFPDAPPSSTTSDGGGKKLQNVKVNLIFWGDRWNQTPAPNPDLATIVNDAAAIIAGPYLSGLQQYGCHGAFLGDIFTTQPGSNPPTNYSMSTVSDFVVSAIGGGLPEPDEETTDNLHVVFMPPGTNPPAGLAGEHSYGQFTDYDFPFDLDWFDDSHTAFVMFASRASISAIFSHELVEAITDPEGDAIQVNPRNSSSWNEIADICSTTRAVNGVTVQAYWSQQDRSCIIPMETRLEMEITCIHKNPRSDPHHPIKKVGGINRTTGKRFLMTQADCIRSIDRGNHFFVANPNGGTVDVRVFLHFAPWSPHGTRYITTVPDNTTTDNLLSLPECDR